MTVVDLTRRITADEGTFRAALMSDDSLVLIEPLYASGLDISSVDLTVGNRIFDSVSSEPREIPGDGIVLNPGQAVVVYTAERVCLPYNVFGLVSGKGTLIFHGVMTSPGKIDPGFQDRLRIGMLNASRSPLLLKPGMPICSCSFFQIESHVTSVKQHHLTEPAKIYRPKLAARAAAFLRENWKWALTTVIALVAAISAIIRALR